MGRSQSGRDSSTPKSTRNQPPKETDWDVALALLAFAAVVCGWLMARYGKPGRADYDDLPFVMIFAPWISGLVIRLLSGRAAGCLWVVVAPIACVTGFAFVDSEGAAYVAFLIGAIFPGAAFFGWLCGELIVQLLRAARWLIAYVMEQLSRSL